MMQYDRAVTQFERAIDLDASSVFAQANLSLARCTLQQFPEAEAAARAALRIDRNFAKAHYLLGLTLAAQDKDLPDAIDHLDKAAHEFPGASLLAARCLAQRGLTAGR